MTDASDRIWLDDYGFPVGHDAGGLTEYVRADRIEALEAENKRLREAVHIDDITVTMQAKTEREKDAENKRLRDALADFVAMGEQYLWDEAATGRAILMKQARTALNHDP